MIVLISRRKIRLKSRSDTPTAGKSYPMPASGRALLRLRDVHAFGPEF